MGPTESTIMALLMAGNLEVTPGELQFQVVVGDYSKRQMRLHNKGDKNIAYKIKTTNPKQYYVRPNQGVVQPNERRNIAVMMGKLTEVPTGNCKDKFLVQSIEYSGKLPDETKGEKFDWRHDVTENPTYAGVTPDECRLRCAYSTGHPATASSPKAAEPSPAPATTTTTSGLEKRSSKNDPVKAPAAAPAVPKTSTTMSQNNKPAAKASTSYSMYLIVAVLFFLVGRFTHEIEIPGL